jgi:teichuronic acid biosynthesis glycosyltransferase TuaC
MSPLRVLTFTTLFPSAARPRHGIFIETRLRQVLRSGEIESRVIAPVPWFPGARLVSARYGAAARTPLREERNGVQVSHPRYFMLPKLGAYRQHRALARAAVAEARRIQAEGWDFDFIDAHYGYPDGVAAATMAAALNKPFVLSFRGTDLNLLATLPQLREPMKAAAAQAAALVTVSESLRGVALSLGFPQEKLRVIRNGVDLELFRMGDSTAGRRRIGLQTDKVVAGVGNLIPDKAFDLLLRAASSRTDLGVVLVGDGPEGGKLEALAAQLGMTDRFRLLPSLPQQELSEIYRAVDVLCLTSVREGWPNVLLEAMACGTPVVAVDVGGVREIVREPRAGIVVPGKGEAAYAAAIGRMLDAPPRRADTRAYAEGFGWDAVVDAQLALYRGVAGERIGAGGVR